MNESTSTSPSPSNPAFAVLRWTLIVVLAFGLLAVVMSWLARSVELRSPIESPVAAAGEGLYPVPDFRFPSLDGAQISPADYLGEVVIIDIWATWCGPCRLQARFLEELHQEMAGQGVRFLAINVGEDEATVRDFVASSPFPYSVLLDPSDSLSQRYQIFGLPTVMIVDRNGAISFLRTGVSDTNVLREELAKAGAGMPTAPQV